MLAQSTYLLSINVEVPIVSGECYLEVAVPTDMSPVSVGSIFGVL